MSFVLLSAGRRHAPRTAARRVLWGVLDLAPLGVISAASTFGAVLVWAGESPHSEQKESRLSLSDNIRANGHDVMRFRHSGVEAGADASPRRPGCGAT